VAVDQRGGLIESLPKRIERTEFKSTDLILRSAEGASRRMAAGTISRVAVLRDAREERAPQDEVD
jgi:hypothetical protein